MQKTLVIGGEIVHTEHGYVEIDGKNVYFWCDGEKTVYQYTGNSHEIYGGYGSLENENRIFIRRGYNKELLLPD